jgi:alkanesulfonate monooxygenase SsuD/methylene tetrahydromethanopterin reductase-like flavin-dependent oxidoreductase (luciferase family)
MEFGMFHEFQCPKGRTEREAFAESMAQVEAAEEYGLDAMWLAELHVNPTRSVLSAPLNIASFIAARTKNMKIGTAVQVLPLCHPLRIAEEAATVDQLSHGRLIFGVGRSGFPRTYNAYGVSYAESQERFAEVLKIVKQAWTETRFTHHGKYYHFDDVCMVPKPWQKPYPEIRVAATSSDTYPAQGEQGYPIFVAVRLGSISELGPNIRAYREAWRKAGHPGEGQVFLRAPMYLAETEAEARTQPQESIMGFYRELGAIIEASASAAGARAIEQRAERGARLQNIDYDEVLRDKVLVGTPDSVYTRLNGLKEELGLDGILAELNCGAIIPNEQVMRSLKLMCTELMPKFKN